MRIAIKYRVVGYAILCIATLAESGLKSCRPTCVRFGLVRSAVDCIRSGNFASEPSPWDLASFRATPCTAGVRQNQTTSLPEELSLWVYEGGSEHDAIPVLTLINVGRDDAFTHCSRYQCPLSECEIQDQFASTLRIDIHTSDGHNGAPIMSLTLGLTIDFLRLQNENMGSTRFGPLVLLWMDDPLKCRPDLVEDAFSVRSDDILFQTKATQMFSTDDNPQYDDGVPNKEDSQGFSIFTARPVNADSAEYYSSVARFAEENVPPVDLSAPSLQEALTGTPTLSPSLVYSRRVSHQQSESSFNRHSPAPSEETRSAIPSRDHSSHGPSALRSPRPSAYVRSERPSSKLSTPPSQDMSRIPTQHSTILIFPTEVQPSLNRSGYDNAATSADTSSSPEGKKGFIGVLVVGIFCLLATAVAVLSRVVRRRSLGDFERRRESERGSCVQEPGANHPSLEDRRPVASPIGSDEWLAGLGSLPSSLWTPGTNHGEDCESCQNPRPMSFHGSDQTSGFDLESNHSSTTNES